MPAIYRIHPGIGVARLGNSPEEFCITPEEPAALPLDCDARGNTLPGPDGMGARRVTKFKDAEGRIKRQAARFQVYVYDDESPEGRPLKRGDTIYGGGNHGTLVDIQWQVYLANKKAVWYEFKQAEGEHGYSPTHPRRNANIEGDDARQRLIIDPGPRVVDGTTRRTAQFSRDGRDIYAPTFPPPLQPCSIDTLGELKTDDDARLLVLGGHGNSGTFLFDEFGQPRIDEYANNDGWFDDTSDGPVTARLAMYSEQVGAMRFVDVELPAWVIVGYPAFVPQILDMVTMDDVLEDLSIREFATRTDLYGVVGTFAKPQKVDNHDLGALALWRADRLQWNPNHKPWFYRDVWPILFRPDQFSYLSNILGQSNFPHNQSPRGNFDPLKLGVPPMIDKKRLAECEKRCLARHHSGELFVQTLAPVLAVLEKQAELGFVFARPPGGAGAVESRRAANVVRGLLTDEMAGQLRVATRDFASAVHGDDPGSDYHAYAARWRAGSESSASYPAAKDALEKTVAAILAEHAIPESDDLGRELRTATVEHLRKFHAGRLLDECRQKCIEACTNDPYQSNRTFLFELLRAPGAGNQFGVAGTAESRVHNLPLMPLLAGDNPISNTLPSKFLCLSELQHYVLRQWARGHFYNEALEGWSNPDPWQPYAGWVNKTGRDLDRGVLSNVLGGAFCPGGEVGWIMRNPAIYHEPYRIKADPEFYQFRETAAQDNAWHGSLPEGSYLSYIGDDLSQDDDFDTGLQPGDLTKHMALPWQADFNECSTQPIDITYQDWNVIYADSVGDSQMTREQRVWETLWWPAHRPLQAFELGMVQGKPTYPWLDWSRGIPQTNAGDLKMVTEWWRLGIVRINPYLATQDIEPSEVPPPSPPPYVSVERTERPVEK